MVVKDTPWGRWDHLPLSEVVRLLEGIGVPWWIAGGYAIDAFAEDNRREHDDIDVGLFATDQLFVQAQLAEWELHCADPPGTLRPWASALPLPAHVHDIWARRNASDSWRFQLMLNPGGPGHLVYRRDERLSIPMEAAVWRKDGVPYLAPEVQLLFKSKNPRPKDEQDFDDCLPLFDWRQRTWLREALELVAPGHKWIDRTEAVTVPRV